MEEQSQRALTAPEIQQTLMAEAIATASVGFVVWDDERHYIAVNDCACRLLGCTRDELIGSTVGAQTSEGEEAVTSVIRGVGGRGYVMVDRFDGGGRVRLGYVTFPVRTAGLPYMASVIWKEDDAT